MNQDLKTTRKKAENKITVKLRNMLAGKRKLFFLIAINPITTKAGRKKEEVSIRGMKSMSGNCAENESVIAVRNNNIIISITKSYRLFIAVRALK